jgi:hypothetical protein
MSRPDVNPVLLAHPSWAFCTSCGELFTSDTAFDRHLGAVRQEGRPTCKAPATVRRGGQRLVFDATRHAWHWDGHRPVAVRRVRHGPGAAETAALAPVPEHEAGVA